MKVHELVEKLRAGSYPIKTATVIIGQGQSRDIWLVVTGLVERNIAPSDENSDYVVSGAQRGVEIV